MQITNCTNTKNSALHVPPLLPIPTPQQLAWQEAELIMFIHFGMNTFYDVEWGDGTEDPARFNPSELDAGQWARVARETGFKTIILTAKHHDGFCLWPSQTTEHSVKNSPWKNGKGDVVRELADACGESGIKLGLYLSPWDRHEPTYGDSPLYNQFYRNQLTELMTGYGEIAEVWFDGACGEGPNGRQQVYDWPGYRAIVRKYQPDAVMFSDAGPDVRWIGNEHGFAGHACWSMIDRQQISIGQADTEYLNRGDKHGKDWVPGECDVSIRKGWFWHPDQQPKSVEQLIDIYFKSVGRNGVLLLNVPANDKGLLPEADVKRLYEFKAALDEIFKLNLVAGKKAKASNVRGESSDFAPQHALDGNPRTFWATEDSITSGWIELDLNGLVPFNISRVEENIALGQRVQTYRIEAWDGSQWQTIACGTTIGHKKLDRFETVKASKVRLVIETSRACPTIREVGLYWAPQIKYDVQPSG